MKVVYKPTIIERIRDARDDAELYRRKIDFIELDAEEWAEALHYFAPLPSEVNITCYRILDVEVRKAT